jgi:hypothetical protein
MARGCDSVSLGIAWRVTVDVIATIFQAVRRTAAG